MSVTPIVRFDELDEVRRLHRAGIDCVGQATAWCVGVQIIQDQIIGRVEGQAPDADMSALTDASGLTALDDLVLVLEGASALLLDNEVTGIHYSSYVRRYGFTAPEVTGPPSAR